MAPEWVSLDALGLSEFALETSPRRAGAPPGAFLDAENRGWSVFGYSKRSQGSWKAYFWGSDDGFLYVFLQFELKIQTLTIARGGTCAAL